MEYPEMIGELIYSKITDSKVPSQIQGEEGTMLIDRIADPQSVIIAYRNGMEERADIPLTDNNMIYEIETFIKLAENGEYDNLYLDSSQIELQIMDEVRRQQNIVFPADL